MSEAERGLTDDGLSVREAGSWAADKLAILDCYLPAFTRACGDVDRFFVDGFAGPGVNRMRETDELVRGSPLIALTVEPPFTRCLFVDLGGQESTALRLRAERYGDRAAVVQADVNTDLVRLMEQHIPRWAPSLCLLDPEGTELKWGTIEAVSKFKASRRKTEVLVLLPTYTGFLRMLPTESDEPIRPDKLDAMFGTTEWRGIWDRKKAFLINKQQAVDKYVELYVEQFRRLGYRHVLTRLIRSRGRLGQPKYHLVFATDHPTGDKIMEHCFQTRYVARRLFPLEGD